MRTIPLSGGKAAGRVAVVDDEDYALVSQHKWFVHEEARPGRHPSGPYARAFIRRDGKRIGIFMHMLLTGWPVTDHANHDGLDNRRENLRPAAEGRNQQNMRHRLNTSSRFKGVTWFKQTHRWHAQIRTNGKRVHLGFFSTEEDAAKAYDRAALEAFGEYACTNFPESACI